MNKLIYCTIFVAAASATAGPSFAQPLRERGAPARPASTSALERDASYAAYRRVVLGDSSVQLPPAPARVPQPLPGTYARYLIHLGWSREVALAEALRIGEVPTSIAFEEAIAPVELTQYELYQRSVLGRSIEEILRERRAAATLTVRAGKAGESR